MKILVVVDMQNDFIDCALGTPEAAAIVDNVVDEIESWDGAVICTRDTHSENYLSTQEGRKLPVTHCVKDTHGWHLNDKVAAAAKSKGAVLLDKPSFGSTELPSIVRSLLACEGDNLSDGAEQGGQPEEIELIGLCTDICVISNAFILKAAFPEVPITVKADCCAGVSPESHETALASMRTCQVEII